MIYTGLPNRLLAHQGIYFGNAFATIGASSNVDLQRTGIKARSSLGLNERYHQPLTNTYPKIMMENPQTESCLALAASVKAMNDTLGSEGLVFSALVFGEFPRAHFLSDIPNARSTAKERARIEVSATPGIRKADGEYKAEKSFAAQNSQCS